MSKQSEKVTPLTARFYQLQNHLADFAIGCQRDPAEIKLLAVSKHQSAESIRQLYQIGQLAFGENRIEELLLKKTALADCQIEWHFIGNIQSNKTRLIAENCDWVQSLADLHHANRLNAQRPSILAPLAVCIQINISNEPQKLGISPNQLFEFAQKLKNFKQLQLRGLMAIIENTKDPEKIKQQFSSMQDLFSRLKKQGFTLDTLSMGMSQDYPAAICAGSTMVRIGSVLFEE